jgi:hypothetical protein
MNKNSKFTKNPEKVKENFCPACLAVPLVFGGAGTAAATSGSNNKIFFWSIVITVVGIILAIWYYNKEDCGSCASPQPRSQMGSVWR